MGVITHTAVANGVLLCIFVYCRLEGSKLLPSCQPIIIFPERQFISEREYSPAHLFDCSIVYVTVRLPTDHEMGASVPQILRGTSPVGDVRQQTSDRIAESGLAFPSRETGGG